MARGKKRQGKYQALALAVSALLCLTGCRQELYSGLSEADANEMLITLLKRGVSAEKVATGKTGFTIEVEEEDMVRALEIIKENSLPRAQFQSLGSVFSGQGMIASQTEEQARLAYAISQELSASFSKISGVIDARVHVVLMQHDQASGLTTPPSAAVFIRHTKDSPVTDMVAGIKDTAAKAVPGLNIDHVSVLTELFQESRLAPKLKVKHWYDNPVTVAAAVGAIVAALGALIVLVAHGMGFRLTRERKAEPDDQQKES